MTRAEPGGKRVRILYFAWVREQAGVAAEEVMPPHEMTDVAGLVAWLRARGGDAAIALADLERLRVAVNQEHARPDHPVAREDEIAFFPPVTGG